MLRFFLLQFSCIKIFFLRPCPFFGEHWTSPRLANAMALRSLLLVLVAINAPGAVFGVRLPRGIALPSSSLLSLMIEPVQVDEFMTNIYGQKVSKRGEVQGEMRARDG